MAISASTSTEMLMFFVLIMHLRHPTILTPLLSYNNHNILLKKYKNTKKKNQILYNKSWISKIVVASSNYFLYTTNNNLLYVTSGYTFLFLSFFLINTIEFQLMTSTFIMIILYYQVKTPKHRVNMVYSSQKPII